MGPQLRLPRLLLFDYNLRLENERLPETYRAARREADFPRSGPLSACLHPLTNGSLLQMAVTAADNVLSVVTLDKRNKRS